jgi:hypothetical protein
MQHCTALALALARHIADAIGVDLKDLAIAQEHGTGLDFH